MEKGVDLLLRTHLARNTGMRLFNTHHRHDPNRSRIEKLRFQMGMLRSFWEDLRPDAPDLVHVKTSSGINFYQNSLYCLEARLRSLPVLLQIHSGRFEAFYRSSILMLRAWIRHTLQSVDRVVVLSEYWRERIGRIAPAARVHVIPNGLGAGEIEDLRTAAEARPSQVFFLGTGRKELNRDKGLDDLLAVLPRLARRHPAARWVVAGLEDPGECRRRLEAQWDASSARLDKVRCLPTLDTQRRIGLLRESTILALPSYFENMPNLLLEGMAAGLGVVATRVGAIPEVLDSGRGGIVIEPGDREALAQGLDRLLGDPFLVRRQGRHNASRVASHYTMSVVEDRFEALYREVVLDRRPALDQGARPYPSEGMAEALVTAPAGAGGATRVLAREALRMSAGQFAPGTWNIAGSPGSGAFLPAFSDSSVPDPTSYAALSGRRPDPDFLPPAPPGSPPSPRVQAPIFSNRIAPPDRNR